MKGLDLCRQYYFDIGRPLLYEKFPEVMPRCAAGLVGDGSECLGYDDDISQDHDFGPGFCLWLTAEDFRAYGAQIQEAYDWLMEMNDAVDPAYVTDEVIDGMANGDMDIAIMYSGDAAYVISENSDMSYLEPSQGTNIWVDAMVIPANSSCPALANEFINFMMEDDIAQMNSEYVGYTSPNTAVRDYLSGELGDYFENPAYLPRSGYDKDEVFHFNEKMTRQLADLYTRVKMSAAG